MAKKIKKYYLSLMQLLNTMLNKMVVKVFIVIDEQYIIIVSNFLGGINMENKDLDLYDIFQRYSYSQLKELFKKAKTKDEQDFYMVLSNIVLQKQQSKVIGK